MTGRDGALPLAGTRVIEIGHNVAAPYAGLVLAELGAEVIKIERPGPGDDARTWGPPFHDGMATIFHALNRNKKSVQLDLKSEHGQRTVRALIAGADVVVQNMRPGQAEQLGLAAADLCGADPRLIYASIGAFGDAGPLAQRPGYDPLMQAFGGIMSVTGEPDRPSVRSGVSIIDMGAAIWIVLGVVTALLRRAETGRGGSVDTSLFETSLAWMTYHLAAYTASGTLPRKAGSGISMIVPYQAFASTDGELVIAAGSDKLFAALAALLGRPKWPDDPRYESNAARVANRESLCGEIAEIIGGETSAHWIARFEEAGVPCAPVQTVAEVFDHPQTQAIDVLRGDPAGDIRFFGVPLRFDGRRPNRDDPAPQLGQHNDVAETERVAETPVPSE